MKIIALLLATVEATKLTTASQSTATVDSNLNYDLVRTGGADAAGWYSFFDNSNIHDHTYTPPSQNWSSD